MRDTLIRLLEETEAAIAEHERIAAGLRLAVGEAPRPLVGEPAKVPVLSVAPAGGGWADAIRASLRRRGGAADLADIAADVVAAMPDRSPSLVKARVCSMTYVVRGVRRVAPGRYALTEGA